MSETVDRAVHVCTYFAGAVVYGLLMLSFLIAGLVMTPVYMAYDLLLFLEEKMTPPIIDPERAFDYEDPHGDRVLPKNPDPPPRLRGDILIKQVVIQGFLIICGLGVFLWELLKFLVELVMDPLRRLWSRRR